MLFTRLLDTPDTSFYVILGYVVFIGVPVVFIGSLLYRFRNLKRDEEMLESLKEDQKK